VAGVFADDAHDIFAFHDAAGFAKALDGCSHFHGWFDGKKLLSSEDKKPL
jgi:hypothetical protein